MVSTFTLPRILDGCRVTRGLFRSRLYLPDADEVKKPTRPASSGTIQVAVGTAVPDLRNVVVATYFSSPMPTARILVICFSFPGRSARSGTALQGKDERRSGRRTHPGKKPGRRGKRED